MAWNPVRGQTAHSHERTERFADSGTVSAIWPNLSPLHIKSRDKGMQNGRAVPEHTMRQVTWSKGRAHFKSKHPCIQAASSCYERIWNETWAKRERAILCVCQLRLKKKGFVRCHWSVGTIRGAVYLKYSKHHMWSNGRTYPFSKLLILLYG